MEDAGLTTGYSRVTTPAVVMRPIRPVASSVNHSAPSGPVVMPPGHRGTFGSAMSGEEIANS